jgi:hypothetical protein
MSGEHWKTSDNRGLEKTPEGSIEKVRKLPAALNIRKYIL